MSSIAEGFQNYLNSDFYGHYYRDVLNGNFTEAATFVQLGSSYFFTVKKEPILLGLLSGTVSNLAGCGLDFRLKIELVGIRPVSHDACLAIFLLA